MATVSETLALPTGAVPTNVTVTVMLAGSDGVPLPVGYATTAGESVVGRYVLTPSALGVWTADLERNDQITPANTAWKIVLSGEGASTTPRYISVTGAGPFDVADILTAAPGTIDSSTYALLEARVAALEATALTIG